MAGLTEPQLVAALEAGTLPAAAFDHVNHVRAAWSYLNRLPLPEAAHRFAGVLQAYVGGVGAADKFHLTLTMAFMHLIHTRMRPGQDWTGFAAANPELFRDARALIAQHYSPARLAGGRRDFAEPDRAPLPG